MRFFDVPLTRVDDTDAYVADLLRTGTPRSVVTPNPEIFLLARNDEDYRLTLANATDRLPDGIGLYVGAMILDSGLPGWLDIALIPWYGLRLIANRAGLVRRYGKRLQGSDLTTRLLAAAAREGSVVAILDRDASDWPEKAEMQKNAPALLERKFPGITIHYEILTEKYPDWRAVGERIEASGAKILLSALGMKAQEHSLAPVLAHAPSLRIAAGIGSSIDYHTGFQKRAPAVWGQLGLEWFYRIFTDKRKLQRIRRIFDAVIVFPIAVARSKRK